MTDREERRRKRCERGKLLCCAVKRELARSRKRRMDREARGRGLSVEQRLRRDC